MIRTPANTIESAGVTVLSDSAYLRQDTRMAFAGTPVFASGATASAAAFRFGDAPGSIFTQPSHMRLQSEWVRAVVPDMKALMSLRPDWDSYGASAPDQRILWWALALLDATECVNVIEPQVVPTIEGGVQFEWYLAPRELEVAFCPTGRVEYLATDVESGTSSEEAVDGRDALGALRELIAWVCGG